MLHILLLSSGCSAADQDNGSNTFVHADDSNKFHGDIFPRDFDGYGAYIRDRQAYALRQKRGTTSVFRVWAELLKTTLGFRWVKFHGGDNVMTFIKVGTLDDAVEDFKLLGPTRVKQEGNTLLGQAGDKAIELELPSDTTRPKLYLGRNGYDSGLIYYVETPEDAQWLLRILKKLSDRHDYQPTIH